MRSIVVGMMMFISVSAAGVGATQAQQPAGIVPGRAHAGPVAHHQPRVADLPGADQVKPDENGLAKVIEQENGRLDQLLRSICRGC